MKLYNKNLSSMAALDREKRRLLAEKELLEEEGLISFDEIVGAVSSSGALGGKVPFILNIASRVAPFASTFAAPLVNLAQGWFASRSDKREHEAEKTDEKAAHGKQNGQSKVKGTLISLGKEVLFSYLKWKAMELSYKGVKHVVKKKKAKKARKAEARQ